MSTLENTLFGLVTTFWASSSILGQMHLVPIVAPLVTPPNAASCYDAGRDRMVMAGYLTAEFDGVTWSMPGPVPDLQRNVFGGAYDPIRRRVVVKDGDGPDTWEWDGVSWRHIAGVSPNVWGAPLCFHGGRQKVVMLGWNASPGSGPRNELWEWDGSQWFAIPNSGGLPQGTLRLMVMYDSWRDKLIAFGGIANGQYVADTWEWDAANGWTQINSGGPGTWYRMVFDEARGVQVLLDVPPSVNGHIWERVGSGPWTQIPSGTHQNLGGDLVYDSRRRRVVLLNGDGLMYSWEPVHPARYDLHGPGCPGTLGTPTLSLTNPWNLPRIGDTLQATVDHALLGFAVLGMGFQASTYSGQPLPIDLGAYQMPGCHLRVPLDATVLLLGAPPTLSFSLPIPNQAGLLGVQFFQQAAIWDPPLNATGIGWTNSMAGLVGAL